MAWAYQVYREDNVATAIGALAPGVADLRGAAVATSVVVVDDIPDGHKVATAAIAAGAPVTKYGIPIGTALRAIPVGSWVHLHNVRSAHDERSSHLDVVTGAPSDIDYL